MLLKKADNSAHTVLIFSCTKLLPKKCSKEDKIRDCVKVSFENLQFWYIMHKALTKADNKKRKHRRQFITQHPLLNLFSLTTCFLHISCRLSFLREKRHKRPDPAFLLSMHLKANLSLHFENKLIFSEEAATTRLQWQPLRRSRPKVRKPWNFSISQCSSIHLCHECCMGLIWTNHPTDFQWANIGKKSQHL